MFSARADGDRRCRRPRSRPSCFDAPRIVATSRPRARPPRHARRRPSVHASRRHRPRRRRHPPGPGDDARARRWFSAAGCSGISTSDRRGISSSPRTSTSSAWRSTTRSIPNAAAEGGATGGHSSSRPVDVDERDDVGVSVEATVAPVGQGFFIEGNVRIRCVVECECCGVAHVGEAVEAPPL